jgi:hypothetical protein
MFNVTYLKENKEIELSVKKSNALAKIVNNHHQVFLRGDEHNLEIAMT